MEKIIIDLKVHKFEIPVNILFSKSEDIEIKYVLYLNEYSKKHTGPEELEEYLNSKIDFIPSKKYNNSFFNLLNLKNILYIREEKKTKVQKKKQLIIHFEKDIEREVFMYENLPEDHSRSLDYFNHPENFLSFTCQETKIYINKYKIVSVEEV